MRTLVIFATHQSRFKTAGWISRQKRESSWDKAKHALRFSINFVRSNAGIESLGLLSSPFLLIPIGVYADLNGEKLNREEEKALLRWFHFTHIRAGITAVLRKRV